jgi:hypothetical protein
LIIYRTPTRKVLTFFLDGLMSSFPLGILAHVLSEEIKASPHVRNDRLLRRKFQPSRLQKLLDEGASLLLPVVLWFYRL